MNRRNFLKYTTLVALVPNIPFGTTPTTGDIRDYGAVEGQCCSDAIEAAFNDVSVREAGVVIPEGKWLSTRKLQFHKRDEYKYSMKLLEGADIRNHATWTFYGLI